MSILKAAILAELNTRLKRKETDIDDIIKDSLEDMTLECPSIKSLETLSLTNGEPEYNLATTIPNILEVFFVIIDDGPTLRKISYEEYINSIANEGADTKSEPESYAIQDKTIYFHTKPNQVYTASIFCSTRENDADSISLADEWRNPLILKCCAEYLERKGLGTTYNGINYEKKYEKTLSKRANAYYQRNRMGRTQYNDLA